MMLQEIFKTKHRCVFNPFFAIWNHEKVIEPCLCYPHTSDTDVIILDSSSSNLLLKFLKERKKRLHILAPLGLIWAEAVSMGLPGSKLCVYDKFILTLFFINYQETFGEKNPKDFFQEKKSVLWSENCWFPRSFDQIDKQSLLPVLMMTMIAATSWSLTCFAFLALTSLG